MLYHGTDIKGLAKEYLNGAHHENIIPLPLPAIQKENPKGNDKVQQDWDSIKLGGNNHGVWSLLIVQRKIKENVVKELFLNGYLRSTHHRGKDAIAVPFTSLDGHVEAIQCLSVDQESFGGTGVNKMFTRGSTAGSDCFFSCGADVKDADITILTESVIDAISGAECLPGCCFLALGGSTFTTKVKALKSYVDQGNKVICAFDCDEPGEKATKAVAEKLGNTVSSIAWPKGTPDKYDINDLLKDGRQKEFIDMVNAAVLVCNMVDSEGQKQREYMQQQEQVNPPGEDPAGFDMASFSMAGRSSEMEKQMLEDKFVLGRLAILGQATVIYAKPNMGKTLLVICLIVAGIKSGELKGEDVFYINADDTYKGLVYKLKIAEQYGFHQLSPGHGPKGGPVFKSDDLVIYISKMIQGSAAAGKVLILDTVKKFTDLMSKQKSSTFNVTIREFISHGGTVIMLAHANKHRDEDKKIIYSGTTDLVDDADCAYTLDLVQNDPAGIRTVKFENFKCRGDVALEAFYQYNFLPETNYFDRLDSVISLDDEERKKVEGQQAIDLRFKKNQVVVHAIIDCINEGIIKKTELIQEAASRSGVSKTKTTQALLDHTGPDKSKNEFWYIEVGERNSHTYHLNYGVSDAK